MRSLARRCTRFIWPDRSTTGKHGEAREDETTALQWTLWSKQAENAHQYLGTGSHVNIVGRLRNNNYEKDGEEVYALDSLTRLNSH